MSRTQQGRPRESAQDTTYRWLKRHIGSLPRQEGTFLTEAEVCEATGMSRTPVREALLRLETEGFLKIMPKKGAFVPPVSDAEIEAVMQARELVEDWCVRRAAPLAAGLAPELTELVDRQKGLLDDPVGFIECDRAFHRAIVRTAGNPVLAEFYESLRDRQVRMGLRAIAAAEDRARVVLAEHGAIVEAIRSGDPLRAAQALAAHLDSTLNVLRLPSVANWDGR
ncbi:GntR family transcriptional regulator [Actinomadura soli]|uniref:GntR family transcriptional regulator n=1 Tax=Actinomadura soli TaxID=2508997 RepID=A0A5C4JBB1_9ACTN|nr:GntR family transcriptional regulator [Actinomadura soli]TMR00528.1 GntR family transcriptional regulator [Actinomadura soli]